MRTCNFIRASIQRPVEHGLQTDLGEMHAAGNYVVPRNMYVAGFSAVELLVALALEQAAVIQDKASLYVNDLLQ